MSNTVHKGNHTVTVIIMLTGIQISILGVVFSDYLLLIGAGITFSAVAKRMLS